MARRVRVVNQSRGLVERVPLFGESDHRQGPVIDDDNRRVGLVDQGHLIRALARAVQPV